MFSGLNKGLQMIADAISFRYRAQKARNTDALTDIDGVFTVFFGELTGVALDGKKANIKTVSLMWMFAADPFNGSRQAWNAVKLTYPGV